MAISIPERKQTIRANQLIIISGVSCAGKSTLIENIRKGTFPDLCKKLGITSSSSWRYLRARDLIKSREPLIGQLVVHYDIYAYYAQKNRFNYLSELIANSDSVIILTLYVPPKILIKRNNSRIYDNLKSLLIGVYKGAGFPPKWCWRIKQLLKKRKAYKEGFSIFLYKRWFLFFSQNSVTAHWILDSSKPNITVADLYEIDSCEPSERVYELITS